MTLPQFTTYIKHGVYISVEVYVIRFNMLLHMRNLTRTLAIRLHTSGMDSEGFRDSTRGFRSPPTPAPTPLPHTHFWLKSSSLWECLAFWSQNWVVNIYSARIYYAFDIFQEVVFRLARYTQVIFANFCHDLMQNHLSCRNTYAQKVLF